MSQQRVLPLHFLQGVTCFDFSKPLNLLVTGGMDHKVRLWNQYVTSQPIVVLHEHSMIVQDVAIYEPLGQIFSYSKDAVSEHFSGLEFSQTLCHFNFPQWMERQLNGSIETTT